MKSRFTHNGIIAFGVFEFNPATGELRKNGLRVRLNQQSVKLLHTLLKAEGRVCTREELRRELWPADTFVDFEHSLNKAVWCLRQALGDFVASPRYIETVAGQGYRFLLISLSGAAGQSSEKTRPLESLAVLPPVDVNGVEECGFLGGQLAYKLTNRLSGMAKLRVLAYSTVKSYNLAGLDPRAAGNQLGVDAVLVGEILQRNGDVIITTELIDARDGSQIWGAQLKESLPQAADRAEQIADEIVQQLQPTLSRIRAEIAPSQTPEPRSTRHAIEILKAPLLRPSIRPKKAFLFA